MSYERLCETAEQECRDLEKYDGIIYTCGSTGCVSSGCQDVIQAITDCIASHDIAGRIKLIVTGCMGLCSLGPLVRIELKGREPVLFKQIDSLTIRLIILEYVLQVFRQKDAFVFPYFLEQFVVPQDLPFFTEQKKIVLANTGKVDPARIQSYIAREGFMALVKVLSSMTPEALISEMAKSGLRGRSGAGFSTAAKWDIARKQQAAEKYIICNGDEGDPGAYIDRSLMESDPFSVIEGIIIAGFAVGAAKGWVFIRSEYALAASRIEQAIEQARDWKLLGNNILGTDFSFDCEVRLGAGTFVCGEETALIATMEGKRGTPSHRPPYPAVKGLWTMPTVINNVKTLANIPPIIRNGADWFRAIGTEGNSGTKVFSITGSALNSGLIEVPMGISLGRIVYHMAGVAETGTMVKAVQIGGPSGGILPPPFFDVKVEYESLRDLGIFIGSGGFIIIDQTVSLLDLLLYYLDFAVDESCGRCAACRIGSTQVLGVLKKIRKGRGTLDDLALLERLCMAMKNASLCGLGQAAANPVFSTLKYFPEEIEGYITTREVDTHER
ncbi:MAG: NADH-quinone oxidoreductase subunit L [Spirochaetales bacterium]|nr:NADH-quinone oxidoreductase subunit L [Spirochaetales bacterium]